MRRRLLAPLAALMLAAGAARAQEGPPVRLLAAGSLRAAMAEVVEAFRGAGGGPVDLATGPSGLLRRRISGGEAADVFASANMEHPEAVGRERGGRTSSSRATASAP